jgi:hypothetical protein
VAYLEQIGKELLAAGLKFTANYLAGKKAVITGYLARWNGTAIDGLLKAVEQAEPSNFTFDMVKGSINHTLAGLADAEKATFPKEPGAAVDWLVGVMNGEADSLLTAPKA